MDGKNLKAALDQLERDTLRFLELVPDVKMAEVRIATNVAFPLARDSSDRALTKQNFEPDNAKGSSRIWESPRSSWRLPDYQL